MSQDSAGPVEHPVLAQQLLVLAGLDGLVEANCWSLSDDDVAAALDNYAAMEARIAAAKLGLVSEVDGRNLGVQEATSTAGWLRGRLRIHPGEASRMAKLSMAVRSECQATGVALSAGSLSAGHAQVISEVIEHLPPVDPPTKTHAEVFLIGQAQMLDPLLLRQAGRALIETLTMVPDADGRLLAQQQRRDLNRVVAADGMVRYSGWLDSEADATVWAALGPLSAPRPAVEGVPDPRSAGQRRADGLVAMAQVALAAGALPETGRVRPTVSVNISLDALQRRIGGAGLLSTGEVLSPAAARRLACDAKIIPMVLGGASQPLDVGRASRTVPAPMHAALVIRDQACAFPACERLAAWAEAHHVAHWADGGATALDNLVLLCLEHHHAVHHHGWAVSIDADGLPTFRAPPWIDPDQQPRRHHRYTLRQLGYDLTGRDPPDG